MSSARGLRWAALSAAAVVAAIVVRASAQDHPFVGSTQTQRELLRGISMRPPRRFRQVGTTSVTLRTDLGDGLETAFKPRTRSHPNGHVSEIAAYRIATILEMDNVPPAISRRIARAVIEQRFQSPHPEDWEAIRDDIIWDGAGMARGVAIYWIPQMRASELSLPAGLEPALPWLRVDGEIPAEQNDVARDLSTLIAFDYLIANGDRFSGGNVSTNEAGDRLFVRDHNMALLEPVAPARYARIRRELERVERFSRAFVARLMVLDEASIRAACAQDPEYREQPMLSDTQITNLLVRQRALLSYIAALVEVHGRDRVMFWP